MIKRAVVCVCVVFLFLTSLVYAQSNESFSAQKGYEFLIDNANNGNYGNDIQTTAFAAMALRNVGELEYAGSAVNYIKSQKETNEDCYPKGSCKPKDTAFAMWVLNEYGEDVDNSEKWLFDAMSSALKQKWFLEVLTSNNGTCKVSYDKGDDNIQKDVEVDAGTFPGCVGSFPDTFFDLNACLQSGLLDSNPGIELDINCNDLGPSTTLSVIYNDGSSFYIIDEAVSSHYIASVENGCFGTAKKGACNVDASLYTNWHLGNVGAEFKVLLYLKNNFDEFKAIDNALLYFGTSDILKSVYVDNLKKIQRNDGSFDKKAFDTAIAVLALKDSGSVAEAEKAIDWLKKEQKNDGSWENNVLKTATVLYSAFSNSPISLGPGIPPPPPPVSSGFCGDGVCDSISGENSFNCDLDCTDSSSSDVCVVNGVCETHLGENAGNCAPDCTCGDNICDASESELSCPTDCGSLEGPQDGGFCGDGVVQLSEECDVIEATGLGDDFACPGQCIAPGQVNECACDLEKKGGFPWWIAIVIVIVLIAAIAFYVKTQGLTKQKRKPSGFDLGSFNDYPSTNGGKEAKEMPVRRPPPIKYGTQSSLDKELDKSIAEAKRIMKKL